MNLKNLGGSDSDAKLRSVLTAVHESLALGLTASLSGFLEAEIHVGLDHISFPNAADLRSGLAVPCGLISFQLEPGKERAILCFPCAAVFSLLELLLGGNTAPNEEGSPEAIQRGLTEIEWALLEEVVRVMAGVVSEAWKAFRPVELRVLALENSPHLLPLSDPAEPLAEAVFRLSVGGRDSGFQIAVPRSFFEVGAEQRPGAPAFPSVADNVQSNLDVLSEAKVELQVRLEGPTMAFRDLAALKSGQVIRLDYSLQKPVMAWANETIPISGQIVSVGPKRGFQVETLP